jgi:hypothetical protein
VKVKAQNVTLISRPASRQQHVDMFFMLFRLKVLIFHPVLVQCNSHLSLFIALELPVVVAIRHLATCRTSAFFSWWLDVVPVFYRIPSTGKD